MSRKSTRIALCVSLLMTASVVSTAVTAQDADTRADQYSAILDQIENVKLATAQRELMLQNQQAEIDSLKAQITSVPEVGGSVREIVQNMTAEIEKQMELDIPFRAPERFARLDALRSRLADPASSESDIFRRAITIYDVETNYGNSVAAYVGDNPINPGSRLAACQANADSAKCALTSDQRKAMVAGATVEDLNDSLKDGNYVHFGRMSFVYLELDSSEGYRWNQETKSWDALPAGDIIDVRRAVRIARGESAPGVVTAPIRMQAAE